MKQMNCSAIKGVGVALTAGFNLFIFISFSLFLGHLFDTILIVDCGGLFLGGIIGAWIALDLLYQYVLGN